MEKLKRPLVDTKRQISLSNSNLENKITEISVKKRLDKEKYDSKSILTHKQSNRNNKLDDFEPPPPLSGTNSYLKLRELRSKRFGKRQLDREESSDIKTNNEMDVLDNFGPPPPLPYPIKKQTIAENSKSNRVEKDINGTEKYSKTIRSNKSPKFAFAPTGPSISGITPTTRPVSIKKNIEKEIEADLETLHEAKIIDDFGPPPPLPDTLASKRISRIREIYQDKPVVKQRNKDVEKIIESDILADFGPPPPLPDASSFSNKSPRIRQLYQNKLLQVVNKVPETIKHLSNNRSTEKHLKEINNFSHEPENASMSQIFANLPALEVDDGGFSVKSKANLSSSQIESNESLENTLKSDTSKDDLSILGESNSNQTEIDKRLSEISVKTEIANSIIEKLDFEKESTSIDSTDYDLLAKEFKNFPVLYLLILKVKEHEADIKLIREKTEPIKATTEQMENPAGEVYTGTLVSKVLVLVFFYALSSYYFAD